MTALAAMRATTAGDHDMVDATFGRFELSEAADYGRFLTAHALALPAVEVALASRPGLPPLRSRQVALAMDLEALGLPLPTPFKVDAPRDDAEAFGMAYVIEGSRLGGTMLARSVPEKLPRAYLSSSHLPGEWQAFGQALENAAAHGGVDWTGRAGIAAKSIFALYARAAAQVNKTS